MERIGLGEAIFNGKCPRCRTGNIFPTSIFSYRKLSEVNPRCPNCGVSLSPEPDFYYGAMYISYAFSVALMVAVLVIIGSIIDTPNVWTYVWTVLVVNIILVPGMLRYSKILYLYGIGKLKYNPELHQDKE